MNARQQPQMKIRLPVELKAAIEDRAQRNFRSLTAEILFLINKGVQAVEGVSHAHQ